MQISKKPNDPLVNRMTVAAVSLTLCACVGGAIGLQIKGQAIPGMISGLGFGSLGILAKVIQPSSDGKAGQ
jgi:uncharacterized membrane protein (UPF0136 family)